VDTGRFPIPTGFRYLLDATKTKAEFFDLCWDANRVLYHHREELKEQWCSLLAQRGLNDKVLFEDVPGERTKNFVLRPDTALALCFSFCHRVLHSLCCSPLDAMPLLMGFMHASAPAYGGRSARAGKIEYTSRCVG